MWYIHIILIVFVFIFVSHRGRDGYGQPPLRNKSNNIRRNRSKIALETPTLMQHAPNMHTADKVVHLDRKMFFEQCENRYSDLLPHKRVFSPQGYNFTYIVNLKAGWSTLKYGVFAPLNICSADVCNQCGEYISKTCLKISPKTVNIDEINGFVFTIVRSPVEKLESGIRQARAMGWPELLDNTLKARLSNMTMDEITNLQINKYAEFKRNFKLKKNTILPMSRAALKNKFSVFFDPHLIPNGRRLAGVKYDFIGTLENLDDSVSYALKNISPKFSNVSIKLRKHNARPKNEYISAATIINMCESDLYRHEWECFGYRRPEVCSSITNRM